MNFLSFLISNRLRMRKQLVILSILFLLNLAPFSNPEPASSTTLARPSRYATSKQKCSIQSDIDPFDKSLKPYIKTKSPIKCSNNFYYAELELKSGLIRPNYSIIKEKSCNCIWNALKIIMKTSDRNQFIFKDFKSFEAPIDMNELRKKKNTDLVLIRCRCGFFKIEKSEKLFSYPSFKIDNRREKAPIQLDENLNRTKISQNGVKKCPIQPNVIVIVIESLSYLNFKRYPFKLNR